MVTNKAVADAERYAEAALFLCIGKFLHQESAETGRFVFLKDFFVQN